MGITATVVRDTVTEDGAVIEDTFDWYAQDVDGDVWYMGEDSKGFDEGALVGTAGSWEVGAVGYRQEYYAGEAEDLAEVFRLDGEATVPHGSFRDLLVIREWNPVDLGVIEDKYYTLEMGLVLEVQVRGGDERIELVRFERP